MKAWGHNVTEFGEEESGILIDQDIVACQIAEGGAMGYHGGVFLISSSGKVYFTCLLEPTGWSGYRKYTPRLVLEKVFPPLKEFECGLMGHGVSSPGGFIHDYLGMGNHLLIKESIYNDFQKLAAIRTEEKPDSILYNLWMDVVCDILTKEQ